MTLIDVSKLRRNAGETAHGGAFRARMMPPVSLAVRAHDSRLRRSGDEREADAAAQRVMQMAISPTRSAADAAQSTQVPKRTAQAKSGSVTPDSIDLPDAVADVLHLVEGASHSWGV